MSSTEGPTLSDVIKKAWSEPEFKALLLADPHGALRSIGAHPPEGIELMVVEGKANRKVLVLPPTPDNFDILTPEQIAGISVIMDTTGPTTFGGMHTCTRPVNPVSGRPDTAGPTTFGGMATCTKPITLDPALDPERFRIPEIDPGRPDTLFKENDS